MMTAKKMIDMKEKIGRKPETAEGEQRDKDDMGKGPINELAEAEKIFYKYKARIRDIMKVNLCLSSIIVSLLMLATLLLSPLLSMPLVVLAAAVNGILALLCLRMLASSASCIIISITLHMCRDIMESIRKRSTAGKKDKNREKKR